MRGYHPSFMEILRLLKPSIPLSIVSLCNITRTIIYPDLIWRKPTAKIRLRRTMLVIIALASIAFMWIVMDALNLVLSGLVPALAHELGTNPFGDVARFMASLELFLLPLCALLFSFSRLLAFRRTMILSNLDEASMFMAAPMCRTPEQVHRDNIDQMEICVNIGCLRMGEHVAGCNKAMFTQKMFDDLLRIPQPAPRYTQDGLMLLPTPAKANRHQDIPDDDTRRRYIKERNVFEKYNRKTGGVMIAISAISLVPLAIQAAIAAGYGVLLGVQSLF